MSAYHPEQTLDGEGAARSGIGFLKTFLSNLIRAAPDAFGPATGRWARSRDCEKGRSLRHFLVAQMEDKEDA